MATQLIKHTSILVTFFEVYIRVQICLYVSGYIVCLQRYRWKPWESCHMEELTILCFVFDVWRSEWLWRCSIKRHFVLFLFTILKYYILKSFQRHHTLLDKTGNAILLVDKILMMVMMMMMILIIIIIIIIIICLFL